MRSLIIFAFFFFSNSFLSIAQSDSLVIKSDSLEIIPSPAVFTMGFGGGLDYGGFGLNATVYPLYKLGIFAGVGYNLVDVGYNFGVKFRFSTKEEFYKVTPFFTAMYGYNAVIKVVNYEKYNKIYYGPSCGMGIDVNLRSETRAFWTLAVLVPFRSPDVKDYIDLLEDRGVVFKQNLFPVAISIGCRVIIGRSEK